MGVGKTAAGGECREDWKERKQVVQTPQGVKPSRTRRLAEGAPSYLWQHWKWAGKDRLHPKKAKFLVTDTKACSPRNETNTKGEFMFVSSEFSPNLFCCQGFKHTQGTNGTGRFLPPLVRNYAVLREAMAPLDEASCSFSSLKRQISM